MDEMTEKYGTKDVDTSCNIEWNIPRGPVFIFNHDGFQRLCIGI